MNLRELDEWQGLTADMVREWLANLDPAIMPSACIADDIIAVSELCGETPQTLLREINPRMRKGWPSESACAVADRWIAQNTRTKVIIVGSIHYPTGGMELVASLTVRLPQQQSGEWSFWPCDEYGNKVRWPTDAEGKML